MDTKVKKKLSFKEIAKFISTLISWTIFVLLLICAFFLVYYFIAIKRYESKGSGYEPKFSLYTIISPSMTPNINVYDVVVDLKVENPEDIKIGDVITFYSDLPGVKNGTVTHRVIAINKDADGKYNYRTKGDYNLVDDGVDVPFYKIVGKVSFRIPQLGRVQFFVASKLGWIMVVLIPALYVIVKDILKILKLKDDDTNNKFTRFLNRPLITFKKRKLLPYTPPKEDEEVKGKTKKETKKKVKSNSPMLKENKEKINNFYDEEDEEDMELPSLK